MAPLVDSRAARRPTLRIAAAALGAVGLLVGGMILASTVAPPPGTTSADGLTGAGRSATAGNSPTTAAPSGRPSAGPSVAPGATPDRPRRSDIRSLAVRAQLQARLAVLRKRLGIPGISVTILFRDGGSWTGTSGLADVAAGTPVTADTAFALASISKTYTAALILRLVADGRIDLDTPARTYLPDSRLDRRITVRQLLDHTSGLDDFFLHPPIDKALQGAPARAWPVARTLTFVGRPYFKPGRGWHYSNTNYLYLGLIAERVTGESLAAGLRSRFLRPLGLASTWYQAAEPPRSPGAHGYRFATARITARPIDLADGTGVMPFTSVVTAAAGAGSIAATSGDIARWARSLYDGEVLGAAMTAEMLAGANATAAYRPRVPYGLGVQEFPIDGRPSVGHSGRLLGFRAAVRHIPGEATTIAVLTNQSRADPGVVVRDLLSIVFAPDPPCFRCPRPT